MQSGIYEKDGRAVVVFGGSVGMGHLFDEDGNQYVMFADLGEDRIPGTGLTPEDLEKVMNAPIALIFQTYSSVDSFIKFLQGIRAKL